MTTSLLACAGPLGPSAFLPQPRLAQSSTQRPDDQLPVLQRQRGDGRGLHREGHVRPPPGPRPHPPTPLRDAPRRPPPRAARGAVREPSGVQGARGADRGRERSQGARGALHQGKGNCDGDGEVCVLMCDPVSAFEMSSVLFLYVICCVKIDLICTSVHVYTCLTHPVGVGVGAEHESLRLARASLPITPPRVHHDCLLPPSGCEPFRSETYVLCIVRPKRRCEFHQQKKKLILSQRQNESKEPRQVNTLRLDGVKQQILAINRG